MFQKLILTRITLWILRLHETLEILLNKSNSSSLMMFSGMVVEELTDLPELGPDLFAGLIVPIEI